MKAAEKEGSRSVTITTRPFFIYGERYGVTDTKKHNFPAASDIIYGDPARGAAGIRKRRRGADGGRRVWGRGGWLNVRKRGYNYLGTNNTHKVGNAFLYILMKFSKNTKCTQSVMNDTKKL